MGGNLRDIIICKTGGSSMARAGDPERAIEIMEADPARRVLMESAIGKKNPDVEDDPLDPKLTDVYIDIANGDETRRDLALTRTREVFPNLDVKAYDAELDKRLAAQYPTKRAKQDAVELMGEDTVGEETAKQGGYRLIRGADILLVTPEFGNADILPESEELVREALGELEEKVCITSYQGKVKSTDPNLNGFRATLGRGGGDTAAAFVTRALRARQLEIWTDKKGIRAASPKIVPDAERIKRITFAEIGELAPVGFNIVHPDAVYHLQDRGIEVHVRHIGHPDEQGTLIVDTRRLYKERPVVGIAYQKPTIIFQIRAYGLHKMKSILYQVLKVFHDRCYGVDHIPTGQNSISVVMDHSQLKDEGAEQDITRALMSVMEDRPVQSKYTINTKQLGGYIVAAGLGLRDNDLALPCALGALAQRRIKRTFLDEPDDRLSFILGVKDEDHVDAVNALYDIFIR